jgi:two-component system sensor histidine kinase UhpB
MVDRVPEEELVVDSPTDHAVSEAVERRTASTDTPADAFVEQDAQGFITDWNEQAEQLFGWSRAEAIGMRSHMLIPERSRRVHDRKLLDLLASAEHGVRRREITALHRDGHEFAVESSISLRQFENSSHFLGYARCLTPQQRADAFRERGERYRAILDQIEDGCCVVDLRGNYLFVNDAFCRMFGYSKEKILGTNFADHTKTTARSEEIKEIYRGVFRTGEPAKAYQQQVSPQFIDQICRTVRIARKELRRPAHRIPGHHSGLH